MIRVFALMLVPSLAAAQVDQGPPNADFAPAFANQTRAPALPATTVTVETFAVGLEHPWGISPLGNGQLLVTERPGRLRVVNLDGEVSAPLRGLPEISAERQGGLLDVAVSPNFVNDRTIFWTYSKPVQGGTVTAAARGQLADDGSLSDVRDIFIQNPPSRTPMHYGSRIIPTADGVVWITTGERSSVGERELAQDNSTTYGKVIRVDWDGQPLPDNPFVGQDGLDTIWSYGHRNPQGAAMGPGGLWTVEHGPAGGDELNQPQAGRNYGWPVISYGVNYNRSAVGAGTSAMEGMEQPVYYWDPVIAPGGMAFYDGPYADWQGDLLIGSLNPGGLTRLRIEDGRVVGEEWLLDGVGRIRDVHVMDDGSVLLLVDQARGGILRVTPQ
ncbi:MULTISPECIES: PQQ-dependent sugar dehydrogenase [unclassified Yoonia]|uniref:PQQ-dependent sugar dehydrogenase n=1 Tax=unclassified Yoonia TaxID=2629118 RepID=UPI002AFEBEF9|nr:MULTISPECIES: PQQ-dependent sugar dehydrogenase [unclassified Yoonia]